MGRECGTGPTGAWRASLAAVARRPRWASTALFGAAVAVSALGVSVSAAVTPEAGATRPAAPAATSAPVPSTAPASANAAAAAIPAAAAPATSTPTTAPSADGLADKLWTVHVQPIFNKSCVSCHGDKKQKGGLDLRTPAAVFAGGTDGSVVIPGRPGESPLFQRLHTGAEGKMPPEKEPALSPDEIGAIREWIATVPVPGERPSAAAANKDWNPSVPSLVELASATKWEPPTGVEGPAAIDLLIQARWKEQQVAGAEVCDDRTFVRRLYLDLAGRIPTRDEADAFVASTESNKRQALVDRLLASDEYPRHLAEVLDVVLMERRGKDVEAARRANGWIEYLRSSVATNRPWNQVVADLIVARPQTPAQKGSAWFLFERKNNHQAMAEAVAPVAFGVSIACAQCHNHPLSHEIKQQQYWGLVAAFNRSANVEGGPPAVSESAVGGFVNFTNLKKESQPAVLALLNDKTVPEARPAEGAAEKDADDKYVVPPKLSDGKADEGKSGKRNKGDKGAGDTAGKPRVAAVPKFSRRQAVADAITTGNPLLARAFVNRMWGTLLGRGFVNPVDQMDSRHPPSHPELLGWLSRDFEASGYDVKRLVRTIVLSRTYQLDSRWTGETPPLPELFARGLEKPLSAEVLHRSYLVATGLGASGVADKIGDGGKAVADGRAGGGNSGAAIDAEPLRQALTVAFPSILDVEYNATLQQAMFLTNSPLFDAVLRPTGRNLSARLLEMSTTDERARTAFVEILGREPDDAEQAATIKYLDARRDRPEAGVRQLTWALLTGAEFLVNH